MLGVGSLEDGLAFVLLVDRIFFAHGHNREQLAVGRVHQRDNPRQF